MNSIDNTIARIPAMTAKQRAALRQNAEAKLNAPTFAPDARRILDALDSVEGPRNSASQREITGLVSWEKHRAGQATFRGFCGEEVVGQIFKRADHSMTDKEVYSVEILGEPLPGSFHHIRDAREAGEQAFVAARR